MKKQSNLSRLMGYAGGHKILTYLSWILSVMSALLALVPFWYIWRIVHDILEASPDYSQAGNVTSCGWSAVLFAVLSIVVYIAGLMCSHMSAFRVAANIRKELMRHITALPLGVTEKYGSGNLRRIVNTSSAATETYLAHRLPDKAGAIATPIGLLFLLLAFDRRLGLLSLVPVVLGVALFIFAVMDFTPGDPAVMILGEGATEAEYSALHAKLGLNDPLLVRYARYIWNALHGDFGVSYRTGLPVFQEIASRLPYTFVLAVVSTIIAVTIGLPVGVFSAVKQYSLSDNFALGCALLLTSMPTFWLAMMLVLGFSLKMRWLPAMGVTGWKNFILPAIATASSSTASLLRMTRSTMLEVIRQDYIRTARAKGAKESRVIFDHALRNALLPVVTLIGVNFGVALGGTIVIEQVFAIPGLGQLMVNAIRTKDTPMVIASLLFTAVIASLINLLVDILYAYIDPRLRAKFTVAKKRKVSA